jgi:hypothetical protein
MAFSLSFFALGLLATSWLSTDRALRSRSALLSAWAKPKLKAHVASKNPIPRLMESGVKTTLATRALVVKKVIMKRILPDFVPQAQEPGSLKQETHLKLTLQSDLYALPPSY